MKRLFAKQEEYKMLLVEDGSVNVDELENERRNSGGLYGIQKRTGQDVGSAGYRSV